MAFNVKELMIDITKAGAAQQICALNTFQCHPTFCLCTAQFTHCLCTYEITYCITPTHVTCRFGTYTCFAGSIVTCGGTIYCAGSNDPTWYLQGIDQETLTSVKAQLNAALKEVELAEKKIAAEAKKSK